MPPARYFSFVWLFCLFCFGFVGIVVHVCELEISVIEVEEKMMEDNLHWTPLRLTPSVELRAIGFQIRAPGRYSNRASVPDLH